MGAELDEVRDERDEAKTQVIAINEQLANERTELEGKINKFKKMLEAKVKSLEEVKFSYIFFLSSSSSSSLLLF